MKDVFSLFPPYSDSGPKPGAKARKESREVLLLFSSPRSGAPKKT